ncbi:uncharacterized protein GLRG_01291 [Colletotrichum graminicola M1.001]|uniref:PAC domain-containing protein n=1 Tax=Colletotrichum graminicola (strain M1.001 / M2 / FGSC 10212) TaxID=645133 RepID=E3Q4Y2_COLGM|nr:uncharacterized protein GLRG_01291 [Colletotrichum graminicola M1.001]EFQ26147.1 hypothetical protein GLRG_01291 [Colletotrichum graminicola M1.001]
MDESEGGADIPDIPFRRPVNQSSMPSHFQEVWEDEDNNCTTHQRPINPIAIAHRHEKSAVQFPENPSRGRIRSPELIHVQQRHTSPSPTRTPRTRSSRSRANSTTSSYQTNNTSLPPLQTKGAGDDEILEPLAEEEIEPGSFDLVVPSHGDTGQYSLEARSELLFSKDHLKAIFKDYNLLRRFTDFINSVRPASLPLLTYYLDCLKALRAIAYANAIANGLDTLPGYEFSSGNTNTTCNSSLEKKAEAAFDILVQEDLPAYITYTWIQIVKFHRTTQYGMNYVIGRNCRFLQGPKTNPYSVKRLREKCLAGKEHYETFLNYRRDGSPFMNLLMVAPLYDSRGTVRYFIGAQVDVSGLAKENSGFEALQSLVAEREAADITPVNGHNNYEDEDEERDEFRELSEMFNVAELETVRRRGGNMHRVPQDENQTAPSTNWHKPRILIQDEYSPVHQANSVIPLASGKLSGIYEHYLLVRPYPSLRILFASPSLRLPGILQSNFMDRIGGSNRVREGLSHAFADGHGVTAKVRWVSRSSSDGRMRWIHCTPLLGSNGAVGVWMVVLVDDETEAGVKYRREAPPVGGRLLRAGASGQQQPRPSVDDQMSLSGFAAMNRPLNDANGSVADHGLDELDRPLSRASHGSLSSRLSRGLISPSLGSVTTHAVDDPDGGPARPPYTIRLGED